MTGISQQLWTEAYRPETLDDVAGHDIAVERFKRFLNPQNGGGLPHTILHGPPGVGKTVVAMAWAKDFYGDDWQSNVREFNASDDRGIDVVRDKIKQWCRTSPSAGHSYKVIFLDEADQLTSDAQSALRRVMEQYADNTRFILTANYINQIIDPLQSRSATFHFSTLDDEDVRSVVENVIEGEGIDAEPSAVDKIVTSAQGRPRDAIVNLRMSVDEGELDEDWVESVTGVVDQGLVLDIFEQALDGDHDGAMERFDVELLKAGANPDLLVTAAFEALKEIDMPEDSRVKAFDILTDIDRGIKQGLNPHVHFHALLGHIYMSQGLSVYEQQGVER